MEGPLPKRSAMSRSTDLHYSQFNERIALDLQRSVRSMSSIAEQMSEHNKWSFILAGQVKLLERRVPSLLIVDGTQVDNTKAMQHSIDFRSETRIFECIVIHFVVL